MADVKWIKVVTDLFDDEKMALIDRLPKHDAIIVIWIKLLCLAGKQNNGGVFVMNDQIPYTEEMLATVLRRPVGVVRQALEVFRQYGMIELADGAVTIVNWGKHQSLASIEKARETTRKRVRKYRERKRAERNGTGTVPCGDTGNAEVTLRNADRIRTEKEGETEQEKETETEQTKDGGCPFGKIRERYHALCPSFPKIRSVDGERRKAVSARWRQHKELAVFEELFRLAEASSFLKGENDRNWHADFDWLMKSANFNKVLEHKYDGRTERKSYTADRERYFSDPGAYEHFAPL